MVVAERVFRKLLQEECDTKKPNDEKSADGTMRPDAQSWIQVRDVEDIQE